MGLGHGTGGGSRRGSVPGILTPPGPTPRTSHGVDVMASVLSASRRAVLPLALLVFAACGPEMAESPATALKSKPNSSIHVGLGLLAKGGADAFVSAGNTGALIVLLVWA